MWESAALGPCGGSNGDQQGIDLQTAQQHGTGKNQLGERGKRGIIPAGGNETKAGAHIIKAGDGSREIGGQAEGFPADEQENDRNTDNI